MKTILTHLQSLPEPYRSQAIENANNPVCNLDIPNLQRKVSNKADAISSVFIWHLSPEGDKYWADFHQSIITKKRPIITK